jgi:hypothetical protein
MFALPAGLFFIASSHDFMPAALDDGGQRVQAALMVVYH